MEMYHELLIQGDSLGTCKGRLLRFFRLYELISFQAVDVLEQRCLPASDPAFWPRIQEGIRENRKVLRGFLQELEDAGASTLDDLEALPQGYPTKLLHTVTHILDGFFGVDSRFFNLVDDSHWVSTELRKRIDLAPAGYWLMAAEVAYLQEARGFEKRPGPALDD